MRTESEIKSALEELKKEVEDLNLELEDILDDDDMEEEDRQYHINDYGNCTNEICHIMTALEWVLEAGSKTITWTHMIPPEERKTP